MHELVWGARTTLPKGAIGPAQADREAAAMSYFIGRGYSREQAAGIVVCGTGSAGNSVAELTIGMMIALTRHFVEEDAAVRSGGWQHTIGPGLSGRTLGVLGLGRLGVPVARLAQAFGMHVIAWSRTLTAERAAEHGVTAVARDELFAVPDILTIHLPLTPETRGLVGPAELAMMRDDAYLINTSRGPIVDEAALLDALRSGGIAGAALDVYDTEPLPVDHPLRSAPNATMPVTRIPVSCATLFGIVAPSGRANLGWCCAILKRYRPVRLIRS